LAAFGCWLPVTERYTAFLRNFAFQVLVTAGPQTAERGGELVIIAEPVA
jgi:uncharacterized protein YciI